MSESRNCPECNVMMDYRLGEYDCPSCGHNESSAASVSGVSRAGSGPGLIQKPPPPPAASGPGSRFGSYQAGPLEHGSAGGGGGLAGLDQEKQQILMFYFGQYLLMGIWGALDSTNLPISGGAFLITNLIVGLIGALILYFILSTDQDWIKFCCMGCTGLGVLSQLITIFAPTAMVQSGMYPPGMQIVTTALGLIYAVWLVSILYRDTQH